MLTEATNGIAVSRKQQHKQNLELESIFKTVDLFKRDLTNAGKGITDAKLKPFGCGDNYFHTIWEEARAVIKVGYWCDHETKTLSRRYGNKVPKIILRNVTDFYISHFPSSNSVLYRIEINNREQIRGYIFLKNLVNKKLQKEVQND